MDQLVSDLKSFTNSLGLKDIHLLGHSMGGMIVLRYALAYPETIASLMLMDTTSEPIKRPKAIFESIQNVIQKEGTAGLLKLMKSLKNSQEVQNGIDYLGVDEHWKRIEEKLTQLELVAYKSLAMALGTAEDLSTQLSSISCPTTVLVGEADAPFVAVSKKMAEAIPKAHLEIIEGAAHCPQYENAEQWRKVICTHLGMK